LGVRETMPSLENKEKVKQIKKWFEKTDSLLVLHYKGLKVSEATELRSILAGYDVDLRVLKNTLTRIALTEVSRQDIVPLIEGPVAVVFIRDDPVAVARAVKDFSRGRADLYLQGGMLEGMALNAGQANSLADLPSKQVLLARLVGQLAAPLSGMVRAVSEPVRKMMGVLTALREKREEQSVPTSAPEPPASEKEEAVVTAPPSVDAGEEPEAAVEDKGIVEAQAAGEAAGESEAAVEDAVGSEEAGVEEVSDSDETGAEEVEAKTDSGETSTDEASLDSEAGEAPQEETDSTSG